MFTWICPKCGREVPPAYDECPDCAAKAGAVTSSKESLAGSPPMPEPPPPQPASAAPLYRPAQQQTPKWLTAVAVIVILVMAGGAVYWFFGRGQQTQASAVIESPAPAAAPAAGAGASPAQRFIEVTGVRFSAMSKGVQTTFLVINHSDSDLPNLAGTVHILAKTRSGGEETVGTVPFQTGLPAQGSKELTLPLNTRLKLANMPDWQNVHVTVEITSPPAA